jgi:hypothetical protein
MYLAAANDRPERVEEEAFVAEAPSARWEHFPHSSLSHHGEACCDVAREWVLAMDFAQLNGADLASGPRWLRQKYKWGPTVWPIHWCDAVEEDSLDCGAHAAIAHEAFAARGLTSFPAQFVQRYSPDAVEQWRQKWAEGEASDHWIGDDYIYHEGVALLMDDGEVKLWDASAGWWINPRQAGGYGSLLSVRIVTGQDIDGEGFRWGEHRIKAGIWYDIG